LGNREESRAFNDLVSVFLLEQAVVPELLDSQTRQWTDRLFSYRRGRQHRQTRQELGSASSTGIHRAQQGYDKQDCESQAARRWLALNASRYSKLNPVYLGDDIYSKQPVCEEVLAVGAHFLFVCKPDSNKTMNEYLTGVEVPSLSRKVKRGKKFFTYTWRWMLGLPIRAGKDALEVNWLEITIRDSNGKITYRNSFVTDLPVDADNVEDLAAAGRARWKIERPSTP
jgi:hypothetical protein